MSAEPKASNRRRGLRFAVILLALTAGAPRVLAQYDFMQQEQPIMVWPRLRYIKFDVEAEESRQSSSRSPVGTRNQRLYLAPALGIGWDYFIYHPDLLNYSILAEPGYVWQESGPPGAKTHQSDVLLNGTLNANWLQLKPYATTIFANSSHNTHQYDFFNSVVEDVRSWGALTGYREGPVPVTVSFERSTRDTTGFSYDTTSDQTTLNLHAQNERKHAITDLSYQYSQFDSVMKNSAQTFKDSSSFHYVTLTDTEHFNKSTLNSTLLFDQSVADNAPSDDLNVSLDYSVEHTPQLRSFYDYSFSRYASGGGESIQNFARAGLQHQLYESLTSSADLHGSSANSGYNGSKLDVVTVGTSASVNYTKRLGSWGRLSLGNSANYDIADQQSAGTALLVPNESHRLVTGQWERLNQPRVVAIVSVTTDASKGNQPLTENVDYFVDRTRDPWQIQIDPFSVIIVSSDTVLVNYTVHSNPSGNYSVFSDQAQIRLDLWNGMVGTYARYNFTENYANTPGFVLENVQEFQAGADFTRRGLRLDANYTDRRSTLFNYHSFSLSEGYSRKVFSDSTVGIDLRQRWSYYPASGFATNRTDRVTYYDFMLRYDWHPIRSIDWSAAAGYEQQRGNGLDQDLFVARTYLNWIIGKLDIHLGYEYQDQKYITERRERHFVFMHARRNF